jgi:hypothetical protein
MKKFIVVISALFVSLVVSTSFAASKKSFSRGYGMAGCGLGSVIVGQRGGQIFAGTTNGTLSNQLFGITFGTLNCTDGPTDEVAMNVDKFIVANRSALASDIAKGDGETLSALTQVIGCNAQSNEMGRLLKSNYSQPPGRLFWSSRASRDASFSSMILETFLPRFPWHIPICRRN